MLPFGMITFTFTFLPLFLRYNSNASLRWLLLLSTDDTSCHKKNAIRHACINVQVSWQRMHQRLTPKTTHPGNRQDSLVSRMVIIMACKTSCSTAGKTTRVDCEVHTTETVHCFLRGNFSSEGKTYP